MNAVATTPVTTYKNVLAAVKEGAAVTQADLDAANEYAKKARRGRIKDAIVIEEPVAEKVTEEPAVIVEDVVEVKPKAKRAPKEKKLCSECNERPVSAMGLCSRDYIRAYRKDDANRERANEASRKYIAKKKAKAEAEASKA